MAEQKQQAVPPPLLEIRGDGSSQIKIVHTTTPRKSNITKQMQNIPIQVKLDGVPVLKLKEGDDHSFVEDADRGCRSSLVAALSAGQMR